MIWHCSDCMYRICYAYSLFQKQIKKPSTRVDLNYKFDFFFNRMHRIIDAMEECALSAQAGNSCENALQASVECIVALLESLQTLCSGNIDENALSDQTVQIINTRYSTLKDVDYSGPLTYQYMARLPAPYR